MRYFLELQRSGRLLTAAKRLNTTHSTVARHIEHIEQHLGTALFVQHAQGYQLTPAGQALLKHAEAMENVALLAQEEITQAITPLGKIRLGVTEGSGIMFLSSRLRELFERYPGLEVELVAVPRFVSILNREAEISVHLDRPHADLLITRKLTDYRLALYASRDYLDKAPALNQPRRSGHSPINVSSLGLISGSPPVMRTRQPPAPSIRVKSACLAKMCCMGSSSSFMCAT